MYWHIVKGFLIYGLMVGWGLLAQDVAEIKELFDSKQQLTNRRLRQELKTVGEKYITSLEALEEQLKAQGNLERVLALQEYKKEFKPFPRAPEIPPALADVEAFMARVEVWNRVKQDWSFRQAREMVALADQAGTLLKKLEVEATQEDRIEDALAFRAERQRLEEDDQLGQMRRLLEMAANREEPDEPQGPQPAFLASIQSAVCLYLTFDRDQRGRVTDVSRLRHPVESNEVTWERDGAKGGAIRFAGRNNSFLKVKTHESLELTESLTLSFWIKPEELNLRRNPIYKSYGAEYTMTLEENGKINFYHGFSGRDADPYRGFKTKDKVKQGEWTHLCLVRDAEAKTVVWYLNGNKDRDFTLKKSNFSKSDRDIWFGRGYAGPFKGLLDEILILNRALDEREVGLLYRSVGGQ